jgi:hypothetical protein
MVPELPQVLEHLPGEHGAPVEERRQQAEDLEVVVQLQLDGVDDLDERGETLDRVVLRLDGDDDARAGDQRVDGEQAERRRAVEDDDVELALDVAGQRVAQDHLAADGGEQLDLGRCELEGRRGHRQPGHLGLAHDLVERHPVLGQDVGHRLPHVGKRDAEAHRQVGLGVHVDAQHPVAELRERATQVDRRRRLPDAALLVRDGDHFRQRRSPVVRLGWGSSSGPRRPADDTGRRPGGSPELSTTWRSVDVFVQRRADILEVVHHLRGP